VQTVKALSAAQDSKLKALLEKKLAKKVLINYTITPDLLGGLIVKYGSSMIDDSLKGKLTRLEIIMKGGQ
jgi:F-type H+-transporting ATPase subunit delta